MLFTLEALKAKHGDALMLHWGDPADPQLALIDGGPSGTWGNTLRRRLNALRDERTPNDELPIRLLVISHIDDDHIRGVLDLTSRLRERKESQQPLPYRIHELWHNSFDDLVGGSADQLFDASVAAVGGASHLSSHTPGGTLSQAAGLVVASVAQGRALRDDAVVLQLPVNRPAGPDDREMMLAGGAAAPAIELGGGGTVRVVGPLRQRVVDLQRTWDAEIARLGLAITPAERASAAAYVDESVYNLASIVLLVESGGKKMLLTGDARGDDILAGLADAGLLEDGRLHVDLLKMPHHGSDRNVETGFFRTVTADHYVISGNGKYGNPEPATFQMLFAARPDEAFTLHLTYPPAELGSNYPVDRLERLLECQRAAGHPFQLETPATGSVSLTVDLGDPLPET
jgi:hypothetical protein